MPQTHSNITSHKNVREHMKRLGEAHGEIHRTIAERVAANVAKRIAADEKATTEDMK